MVIEIRRYLGNTLSAHVHDADHEAVNWRLGHIATDHRRWYDSLEEASRLVVRGLLLVHGQAHRSANG